MSWRRSFTLAAACLVAAVLSIGCSQVGQDPQAAVPTASGDPAVALVQRFKLGAGFESLANQAAGATTTFATLAQKHGVAGARQRVRSEISKAIPSYQRRWDQNLASIYSRHFTAEELGSLAAQGTRSPYAEKFRSTQAAIAGEMRDASSPLLQELVTGALSNAVDQQ